MKDCARIVTLIGARPGELSSEEETRLAAHLTACSACRARAADARATEGLVREALLARANARDFSDFSDAVLSRVRRRRHPTGVLLDWFGHHRRAAVAALAPVVAAAALLAYVRLSTAHHEEVARVLELNSEGNVTMVLQTNDGPLVLLGESDEPEGT